jgi:hypothetical protein
MEKIAYGHNFSLSSLNACPIKAKPEGEKKLKMTPIEILFYLPTNFSLSFCCWS